MEWMPITIQSGWSNTGPLHAGEAENPVAAQFVRLAAPAVSFWY